MFVQHHQAEFVDDLDVPNGKTQGWKFAVGFLFQKSADKSLCYGIG